MIRIALILLASALTLSCIDGPADLTRGASGTGGWDGIITAWPRYDAQGNYIGCAVENEDGDPQQGGEHTPTLDMSECSCIATAIQQPYPTPLDSGDLQACFDEVAQQIQLERAAEREENCPMAWCH